MKKFIITFTMALLLIMLPPIFSQTNNVFANEENIQVSKNILNEDNFLKNYLNSDEFIQFKETFEKRNNFDITDEDKKYMANFIYRLLFTKLPISLYDPNKIDGKYSKEYKEATQWFANLNKEELKVPFKDFDGKEKSLYALYIKNPIKTNKTMIIRHGYTMNSRNMGPWAKIFYDLGYNLLIPDARIHGKSVAKEGTFGWYDKDDLKIWIDKLISLDEKVEMGIFGISLGGSTTMLDAGENYDRVKLYIEDCGYNNLMDLLKYVFNNYIYIFAEFFDYPNLTSKDMLDVLNIMNERFIKTHKIDFETVNSAEQLKKNFKPILFIYGEKDAIVPPYMLADCYESTCGIKELLIFPEGEHIGGIVENLPEYKSKIAEFLKNNF